MQYYYWNFLLMICDNPNHEYAPHSLMIGPLFQGTELNWTSAVELYCTHFRSEFPLRRDTSLGMDQVKLSVIAQMEQVWSSENKAF